MRRASLLWLSLLALSHIAPAGAQTTYRWIDPASGRTVFSDKPPPSNAKHVQQQSGDAGRPNEAARPASNKPLVTLYTAGNCQSECKEAREFLKKRNIVFSEKEVNTQATLDELKKRIGGDGVVPSLTVGKLQAAGFQAENWTRLLNEAFDGGGR